MENHYTPIAKIGENVLVWSRSKWTGYTIQYWESLPLSSQSVVDFGNVAASATIQSALVQSLRLDDGYLIEIWMRPLTDVEVILWHLQGAQKYRIKNMGARVSLLTGLVDPAWLTSRFYVIGKDLDPYIEIRNPSAYATQALIAFWGNKYLLAEAGAREKQMIDGIIPATRVVAAARES